MPSKASASGFSIEPVNDDARELMALGFDVSLVNVAMTCAENQKQQALQLLLDNPHWLMKQAEDYRMNQLQMLATGSEDATVIPQTDSSNFFVQLNTYLRQRIGNCAGYCPICDKPHGYSGIKPTVCRRKECIWKYEEMGLGIALETELKTNYHVVDLLISMAISAANAQDRRDSIWEDFPGDFIDYGTRNYTKLLGVLNSLPSVAEMAYSNNLRQLLATTCKHAGYHDDQLSYRLLRFLLGSNNTHLVRLGADEQIEEMGTPFQYKILCSTPEHEKRFQELKAQYGSTFFFHGSPLQNWHSIMRNGLRNKMCHVPGIYMAPDSSISVGYMRIGSGSGWSKSLFGPNISCLCMVECIKAREINETTISVAHKDEYVVTRYFFIYQNGTTPPSANAATLYAKYGTQSKYNNYSLWY
eukprot:CAMPEP_0168541892 /NCGR_PEP_ID=MMETSP0413-20121227/1057_1 /TAXON_ID=136452 /ORGANISM="Filamoeba nolandi, Strain NC-AS-23-1" /LENGTH=414 /DNA_ID=CAMNT_0008571733 /DNA_START=136 /DNA_END=1380 /DNA_ORIENTATION=-